MAEDLLELDHSTILIPRDELNIRLGALRTWNPETLQVLEDLLEGLQDPAPADEIAERLELVPDLLPGLPVARWARIYQTLIPETHGDPRHGKKNSDAVPGSRPMVWRLEERARTGLALFHDRDTHGLSEPGEQLFLFGTESAA